MLADSAPRTRAEWHASRTEHLCTRGARFVTGSDIVRLSRALALEPWHMTQTAPAAADDPTGIVTDGGRRRVNLRLANGPNGCVFLLRTSGGLGHCGLGELAPVSCRSFPAHLAEGIPPASSKPQVGSRQLTEEDLDQEMLARAKRDWSADRDHWFEVVKRWNALSEESESDDEPGIRDFQRYLLESHAAREAGTAWPGEGTP
ncbi:hypothetical protein [Streptomyces sp. NBC_01373]|uniref:hypothetical protein n=1 Tax=unclassified Streptomyces TaxID=2593676 RepID=UPI00224FC329|nr:hypothetical protein [Streptomyces sp. NBC_01373]MCX4703061.1 hypothetical protein [Streptomyces sp. NBC_01373]